MRQGAAGANTAAPLLSPGAERRRPPYSHRHLSSPLGRSARWGGCTVPGCRPKPEKMKIAMLVLTLALSGCRAAEPEPFIPPNLSPTPDVISPVPAVRNFRIRISVKAPEDLLVAEGDRIEAGAILASQEEERIRLEKQRKRLEGMLAEIERPLPRREIPPLPPVSYQAEEAAIQKAQAKVDRILATITQQRERVREMTDFPEVVLEHETAKLQALEQELTLAELDLLLARGSLEQAQQRRADAEYAHQIRVQENEANKARSLESNRNTKAQLLYQLNLVEYALSQVTTIRAPWAGNVQRIRWLEQRGNELIVELTLGITSNLRIGDPLPPGDPILRPGSDGTGIPEQPEAEEPQYPPLFGL